VVSPRLGLVFEADAQARPRARLSSGAGRCISPRLGPFESPLPALVYSPARQPGSIIILHDARDEEMDRVKREIGAAAYARGRFPEAISLFREISLAPDFGEFLTIPAYKLID